MSGSFFPDFPGDPEEDSLEILVANNQSSEQVEEEALVNIAREILIDADYRFGELSLAVVDDETIHQLNRQYLEHDYATDVLSFLLEEEGSKLVGEIILSADTAAREAQKVGWATQTEMLLYVIHGVLHLVGYDDLEEAPRLEMRRQEKAYLIRCGIDSHDIDLRLPDAGASDDTRKASGDSDSDRHMSQTEGSE